MMPTTAAGDEQTIRAMSARWLRAVEARDPKHVAAFYAEDGVFLVPNTPSAHGRESVGTLWTQLLAAPNLSLHWTPHVVEVAHAGDIAYEIGRYELAMDGESGRIEDDGKYVVVWRKREGDWEVVADIFNSDRPIH